MIYLISWRGRGYLAFLAIFFAVLFALPGALISDDMAFFAMTVGWVIAGVTCFVLGKRWNRIADVHRFCNLRLQTWSLIYVGVGIFLMPYAFLGMQLVHHRHGP